MCGIVAAISNQPVLHDLIEGLKRLEYRGYDSAGVATVHDGVLLRKRAQGKVQHLADLVEKEPMPGTVGIAHTRWATHGKASEKNAHPHMTSRVAIVHNGIIENHCALRAELIAEGRTPESETDSEILALLVDQALELGFEPSAAVRRALDRVQGTYAVAAAFAHHPNLLVAARSGSPLAIGIRKDGTCLASDIHALSAMAEEMIHLEQGDLAELYLDHVVLRDEMGNPVSRPVVRCRASAAEAGKGEFEHYMLKEIYEQPRAISRTLDAYLDQGYGTCPIPDSILASIEGITVVACGTSFHAGLVSRPWFEEIAELRTDVEIASELRFRKLHVPKNQLAIFISQSGETADTRAALHACKERGLITLALVNVPDSAMCRDAEYSMLTDAGPEVGVASTKAFTAQLVLLYFLALRIASARGTLSSEQMQLRVEEMRRLPETIDRTLLLEPKVKVFAKEVAQRGQAFFIGRGSAHALSLEGALKAKETSYIHAEGFAAGELKHGSIALIDDGTPVFALVGPGPVHKKTLSNAAEVAARGAHVVVVAPSSEDQTDGFETISTPDAGEHLWPLVSCVILQLLSYYVALERGTDVDKPRNLAKSVTVE